MVKEWFTNGLIGALSGGPHKPSKHSGAGVGASRNS